VEFKVAFIKKLLVKLKAMYLENCIGKIRRENIENKNKK